MISIFPPCRFSFLKHELAYIILFYAIGDVVTTYYALPYGYESNTFVCSLLSYGTIGVLLLFLLKFAFVGYLYFIGKLIKKTDYKFAWIFIKTTIFGVGLLATVSNTLVILTGYNIFQWLFL